MARTTEADVNAIMDIDLTDAQILVYINIANAMVTNTLGGEGVGDTTLTEIERWLSAHLIASTIARMGEQEKAGDAEIKYIGKYGKKFESTPYGQTVLILDTTGKFAASGKKAINITAITSFDT